jgi:arabinogalactan oligomer / maltooligosaccharide transport system substrate-binding protein
MRITFGLVIAVLISLTVGKSATASTLPRVDLVMWYQEEQDVMRKLGIQQIFDSWAAQNAPGSTLTLISKMAEDLDYDFRSVPADRSPDLLWAAADFAGPLAAAHLIRPIDKMVDTTLFVPAITAATRIDDRTYGIPLQAGNHLMLYYNKKMVKTAPKTFVELVTVAKNLAAQYAGNDQFVPFAYYQFDPFWVFPVAHAFGATEFTADGKTPALDTPGWISTYQLLHDLKFKDQIEPDRCDFECADSGFKAGTTAMILNVDWALYGDNGYIKVLADDLGVAPWPSVGTYPQQIPLPFVSGLYLFVPQTVTGDKLQTASAFAKFLTTDEETTLSWTLPIGRLPALLSGLRNDKIKNDPILITSSAVMLTGVAQPVQREADCVWRAVKKQNALIMVSAATAADAAKNAQKEATECIAGLE